MQNSPLHKAQLSILRSLRHAPLVRYSELMKPTGLESDVFKFHLRKLLSQGYIHKLATGLYELTPSGKEFANNLDKTQRKVQKQPKLSIAIIAKHEVDEGVTYLFQQRLRSPYHGFWGLIGGPARWGESFEAVAWRELLKQTGLSADFTIRGFYRQSDYDRTSDALLEDKLFVALDAVNIQGELSNDWPHGNNAWMSVRDLQAQEYYFDSSLKMLSLAKVDASYHSEITLYSHEEY
jgi:ADP-ribose pyrophosphatase YjhB (NUDIX family)/predicted transcriptional regulator